MSKYSINKLTLLNLFLKPKSSLIICLLLLIVTIKRKLKIKQNSLLLDLVKLLSSLSKDHQYLLNTLLAYSKPIRADRFKDSSDIEIHSMVSNKVLPYYIVMAKSFQYFSQINTVFVVHDDGTLKNRDLSILRHHLPNIKIITFLDSTKEMSKVLKKYPVLRSYRLKKHPNKINIISTVDIPYYSNSDSVFYIDADILFFNKPTQICNWLLDSKIRDNIFYMNDHSDCYVLSEEFCKKHFGVNYYPKFNMGILMYPKNLLNLKAINQFFTLLHDIDRDNIMFRDQTYFMIHFQKAGSEMKVLDKNKYLVYGLNSEGVNTVRPKSSNTICCHYTSTVRDEIFTESIALLFKIESLR